MTTVLADHRLGVMVSDSCVSDGHTVGAMRKVWRVKGALVGLSGPVSQFQAFLDFYKHGTVDKATPFAGVHALVLTHAGLTLYTGQTATPVQCGMEAIGTGGMAALSAYEALGHTDPAKAVRIVCKHDSNSRGPVRSYRLTPQGS